MKTTPGKKSSAARSRRKPAAAKSVKQTTPFRAAVSPIKKEIKIVKDPFWNIWDSGDDFKVRISVPGLTKKDIKVNVNGNILTISCDSEDNKEQSKKNYIVREYSYNAWSRSIALPEKVNPEDIKIKYKDGVLKLDLPKSIK